MYANFPESGEVPGELSVEDPTMNDEDMMAEENLDNITRLEKYYNSDVPLQRMVLMRDLYDIIVEVGYEETLNRLMKVIASGVNDSEAGVRQLLAAHFAPISEYFIKQGGEGGYNEVVNTFMPYCFELIIDKNTEVAEAATRSLVQIAKLLQPAHVEEQLLSVVINLAHDDRVEDYRVVAAELLNEISEVLGATISQDTIVAEMAALAEDTSFSVRKTVAGNLGKISQVIGPESTAQKVLPIYLQLCKDEIWGVRKACADAIVEISKNSSPEIRSTQLLEAFEKFVDDVSRWVRNSAYQQLGPFIATFNNSSVPDGLLQYFTRIIVNNENIDNALIENCAYNFPAVTLVLGPQRWKEIEQAYLTLIKDVQWKVRRTLAASLHELAKILGQEITETVLIQAFELFLLDLDEVKISVVENISSFMSMLGTEARSKFLPSVCNLPNETDNWRIRNELARQVGKLSEMATTSDEYCEVLRMLLQLCRDGVYDVRVSAVSNIGLIVKRMMEEDVKARKLNPDNDEYDQVLKELLEFIFELAGKPPAAQPAEGADNNNNNAPANYANRQLFVMGCSGLAEFLPTNEFLTRFMPTLLKLTKDSVANVRIAVAQLLSRCLLKHEELKTTEPVLRMADILAKDSDRDVIYFSQPEKSESSNNNNNNNNNNNTKQ